jgi:transglutaminase-like putative cysteine protease
LQENYVYSLTAENDSENPVMSFLTETKSGHCSLYASAMTLIMRELGFPARYCTGFVVNPAGTEGHVTLRARNLHAWCEVYLGELGWVTFDPTGSAANTGNNAAPVWYKPETA